jgi:hypothetical protein
MPDDPSAQPGGKLDLLAPLRQGSAWRVAAVVGTLINLYGQLLVPWLNGEPSVLEAFRERALLHPGTTASSLAVAYLFPLGVSVYSAAAARRSRR